MFERDFSLPHWAIRRTMIGLLIDLLNKICSQNVRLHQQKIDVEDIYLIIIKTTSKNILTIRAPMRSTEQWSKDISLANLGHEECDTCQAFQLHDTTHSTDNLSETCEILDLEQTYQ